MDKNNMQNNLKLHQTVRFFETLLRASADGIVITDPARNIIFVNETFCEIFSSNRHDVIETNLFLWLKKLGLNAEDIWKGLETRTNEHGIAKDVEFAMKTGEEMIYFSVNSSLLEKIDIEEAGLIISIWRDDTERKMAREALQQAYDELEMRVKERTAQLTDINIELKREIIERKRAEEERIQLLAREHEARAEAEAARKLDRMKSMFIAGTSHELRTPLNSIIGFTSLILDGTSGELNPEQKEQLKIVHSSGKHLLALINDIIDLSKMEAGRINVEISEFKLGEVLEEAFSILNIILKKKKIELNVDVGDILMKSDHKRLLQCLMNLLGNAIKYTEKGSIVITAKVIQNKVEISVTDTGIGIKKEDIPKIFGPFVRLQTPLTARTSGTGLGLYLVKKLATDFLGGDVEVKSEYGKGSTFTLSVPVELEGKL